jgi:splicing factor U2AF 35 kDa subunit
VNCPFYHKIGACRHSDRCSRLHHKPAFSPTILIKHLYRHPVRQAEMMGGVMSTSEAEKLVDKERAQEDFFVFYEDVFMELSKFGQLEALHVVDNLGDHMIGHVYANFRDEEMASDALQGLQGRYYDGRTLQVEFSPVTDFREARCRDYDEESCARGGFCNFLHVKHVPICLIRSMEEDLEDERRRLAWEKEQKEYESRRDRKKKRRDDRDHDIDRDRDRKKRRSRDGDDEDRRRRHHNDDDDDDDHRS